MKIVSEVSPDIKRQASSTRKFMSLLLCFLMVYLIWNYLSSASRIAAYHSDCQPLFSGRPTSACYETSALATYEEDRSATGKVYWYFIRFKLSDGREITTRPKSDNPPRYLNGGTSIDGSCRVRIWRDKIVEVRNNQLYFPTRHNPEIDLTFLRWMLVLTSIIALFDVVFLLNEIKHGKSHSTK